MGDLARRRRLPPRRQSLPRLVRSSCAYLLPRLVTSKLSREATQFLPRFEAARASHLSARCAAVMAACALTLLLRAIFNPERMSYSWRLARLRFCCGWTMEKLGAWQCPFLCCAYEQRARCLRRFNANRCAGLYAYSLIAGGRGRFVGRYARSFVVCKRCVVFAPLYREQVRGYTCSFAVCTNGVRYSCFCEWI